MNRFMLLASAVILTISSCNDKKEAQQPTPPPAPKPTTTASPFAPNPNGQLTPLQAKFWLAVNPTLDSIAITYSEKLTSKDTAVYNGAATEYNTARESTCKSAGLSGGYEEYLWISKNIGNPVNKPLLDSLKLQTM